MFVDFWSVWMRNSVGSKYFHVAMELWNEIKKKKKAPTLILVQYSSMLWIPQRYGLYHIWICTPNFICLMHSSTFKSHRERVRYIYVYTFGEYALAIVGMWFLWSISFDSLVRSKFDRRQRPTKRISLLYHHLLATNEMNMHFFRRSRSISSTSSFSISLFRSLSESKSVHLFNGTASDSFYFWIFFPITF